MADLSPYKDTVSFKLNPYFNLALYALHWGFCIALLFLVFANQVTYFSSA